METFPLSLKQGGVRHAGAFVKLTLLNQVKRSNKALCVMYLMHPAGLFIHMPRDRTGSDKGQRTKAKAPLLNPFEPGQGQIVPLHPHVHAKHVGLSIGPNNDLGSVATGRPRHRFVVVDKVPSQPLIPGHVLQLKRNVFAKQLGPGNNDPAPIRRERQHAGRPVCCLPIVTPQRHVGISIPVVVVLDCSSSCIIYSS